jgi:solute carrier family 8 (sodium/calcium exchanger)
MAISAVCVYGIPNGETRRIDQIGVFGVTASFSIFAYLWLLIVLKGITPNVIDVWEAVLTFIFFPVLVLVAYAVDKRWIQNLICKKSGDAGVDDKQRQIELGTLQPGESTYRNPIFRFLDSSTFSTNYLRLTFQDLFKSYLASKRCRHSKDMQLSGLSTS